MHEMKVFELSIRADSIASDGAVELSGFARCVSYLCGDEELAGEVYMTMDGDHTVSVVFADDHEPEVLRDGWLMHTDGLYGTARPEMYTGKAGEEEHLAKKYGIYGEKVRKLYRRAIGNKAAGTTASTAHETEMLIDAAKNALLEAVQAKAESGFRDVAELSATVGLLERLARIGGAGA